MNLTLPEICSLIVAGCSVISLTGVIFTARADVQSIKERLTRIENHLFK